MAMPWALPALRSIRADVELSGMASCLVACGESDMMRRSAGYAKPLHADARVIRALSAAGRGLGEAPGFAEPLVGANRRPGSARASRPARSCPADRDSVAPPTRQATACLGG